MTNAHDQFPDLPELRWLIADPALPPNETHSLLRDCCRRGHVGVLGELMDFRIADTVTDGLARLTGVEKKAATTAAMTCN